MYFAVFAAAANRLLSSFLSVPSFLPSSVSARVSSWQEARSQRHEADSTAFVGILDMGSTFRFKLS